MGQGSGQNQTEVQATTGKTLYITPELKTAGTVQELTQLLGGTGGDALSGSGI